MASMSAVCGTCGSPGGFGLSNLPLTTCYRCTGDGSLMIAIMGLGLPASTRQTFVQDFRREMLGLTDYRGISSNWTTVQVSDRESRLAGNSRTLYHQTKPEASSLILGSQEMLRGSSGLVGGGIYFAESPEETEAKAHHHGPILQAQVRLGRIKTVSLSHSSITFSSLLAEGYDSVCVSGRASGLEFVVYNKDQVINIRLAGDRNSRA